MHFQYNFLIFRSGHAFFMFLRSIKYVSMNFYHITTPEIWARYQSLDYCEAESLHTEGFIHCSYAEQVEPTLSIYFKGVSKVILLEIDPKVLTSKLVVETSRDGLLFPHIYGVINKSAIIDVVERDLSYVGDI